MKFAWNFTGNSEMCIISKVVLYQGDLLWKFDCTSSYEKHKGLSDETLKNTEHALQWNVKKCKIFLLFEIHFYIYKITMLDIFSKQSNYTM